MPSGALSPGKSRAFSNVQNSFARTRGTKRKAVCLLPRTLLCPFASCLAPSCVRVLRHRSPPVPHMCRATQEPLCCTWAAQGNISGTAESITSRQYKTDMRPPALLRAPAANLPTWCASHMVIALDTHLPTNTRPCTPAHTHEQAVHMHRASDRHSASNTHRARRPRRERPGAKTRSSVAMRMGPCRRVRCCTCRTYRLEIHTHLSPPFTLTFCLHSHPHFASRRYQLLFSFVRKRGAGLSRSQPPRSAESGFSAAQRRGRGQWG